MVSVLQVILLASVSVSKMCTLQRRGLSATRRHRPASCTPPWLQWIYPSERASPRGIHDLFRNQLCSQSISAMPCHAPPSHPPPAPEIPLHPSVPPSERALAIGSPPPLLSPTQRAPALQAQLLAACGPARGISLARGGGGGWKLEAWWGVRRFGGFRCVGWKEAGKHASKQADRQFSHAVS